MLTKRREGCLERLVEGGVEGRGGRGEKGGRGVRGLWWVSRRGERGRDAREHAGLELQAGDWFGVQINVELVESERVYQLSRPARVLG